MTIALLLPLFGDNSPIANNNHIHPLAHPGHPESAIEQMHHLILTSHILPYPVVAHLKFIVQLLILLFLRKPSQSIDNALMHVSLLNIPLLRCIGVDVGVVIFNCLGGEEEGWTEKFLPTHMQQQIAFDLLVGVEHQHEVLVLVQNRWLCEWIVIAYRPSHPIYLRLLRASLLLRANDNHNRNDNKHISNKQPDSHLSLLF